MSGVSLQIPVLFDVSAGAVVFGQDTSGIDIFDAHLKFNVAAGTATTNLKTELQNIMYADAPEVFTDGSGVLFFSASANASTGLGQRINQAILGATSKLTQPGTAPTGGSIGNNDNFTTWYRPPGIPLPNYDISRGSVSQYTSGVSTSQLGYSASAQGYYTGKITETGGTSFGRILIRLMATHLMGHPFAQDFIANEQSILDDISNCDVSPQVSDKLLKHDTSFFTTIKGVTHTDDTNIQSGVTEGASTAKNTGICNTILFNLYESLLGSAPERFDLSANGIGTDVSGSNDDHDNCFPRKLPFRSDDTIAFYFSPTVQIKVSDNDGISLTVTNNDLSGVGQATASAFSSATLTSMFFNPRHRWIGHDGAAQVKHNSNTNESETTDADDTFGAGRDLLMTGTDLHHDMSLLDSDYTVLFDGHVWKCILTL